MSDNNTACCEIIGVIGQPLEITGIINQPLEIMTTITGSGPKGEQGEAGQDGYTPVKGVDYFTQEEIDEFLGTIVQDKYFTYHQQLSSETWTITHNLGKFPSVTIVTDAKRVVMGDITYVDENQVVINLSAPFSGYAFMN